MKKVTKVIFKAVLMVALVGLVSSCSDGAHPGAPMLTPMLTTPNVVFKISKVGGSEPAGSSVTVKQGDSVLLEWSVGATPAVEGTPVEDGGVAPKDDAKKEEPAKEEAASIYQISLDAEARGIHLEKLKEKDSLVVDNMQADTIFVLSVKSGEDKPITRQVTATVESATKLEVTFTATPEKIVEGEAADLCWQITRDDAAFSIVDSFGNTITTPTQETVETVAPAEALETAEGGEETVAPAAKAIAKMVLVKAEGEEPVPAEETTEEAAAEEVKPEQPVVGLSDCVQVFPGETTTYYMNVTASGEAEVKKEVTVTVDKKLAINMFTATPQKISGPTDVTLVWEVVPAEAVVTLVVGEMTIENLPSSGSQSFAIAATTAVKLSATYGEQEVSDTGTIELLERLAKIVPTINGREVDASTGSVDAGTFFEGEEITVGWNASANEISTGNIRVSVSGRDESFGATGEVKVPVTGDTITITASGEGVDTNTATINVNVRKWDVAPTCTNNKEMVSIVGMNGSIDSMLVGFAGDLAGDDLEITQIVAGTAGIKKIPYATIYTSAGTLKGKKNPAFIKDLNTFPINAIAVDSADRIFVGTSGGIIYSDDMGTNWKALNMTAHLYNDGSYPGSHRSCKGKTQDGRKGSKDTIVSLAQVCDIVIDKDGKLYAAFDNMVTFLENGVDAYLTDGSKGENLWKGLPKPGDKGNEVFGLINHDLEIAYINGAKAIFSATDKGLFMSTDGGYTWSLKGFEGTPVYAVAVDVADGMIYAGGDEGAMAASLSDYNWKSFAIGTVYDLAIDPVQVGTVYAGTAAGIQVSRNKGETWTNVTKGAMAGATKVEAISISVVGDKVGIFTASDIGAFSSVATVDVSGIVAATPTLPVEEEPAAETPAAPTVGGEPTVDATKAMGGIL